MEHTAQDNKIYQINFYPVLESKGKISALEAKLKAESEYEKYSVIEDKNYASDFDKRFSDLK